ncbi:MarR family winged helix-turn-helix transcriptional regulator [Levilactobacillus tongjiangensis]|uniref:MarR family winged helix-turn-helix transcriptional regulator n=1 Tax=Levilactobacillus tongjiangensis TaxID=2486023 RepID=A0ABW1STH4_9LACO|nr:MarR family winged helix-turn-helix transcriptional regulator [Levilactobacillus tongjiangensis]
MPEILRTVGSIARALDSIANREFQQVALTKGQYLYLARVAEHPGIIQERVAEMLKVDRTTAARAIARLTKLGLLEKRADQQNKKIRRLYVTARGSDIYPLVKRENDYSNAQALRGFTPGEANQLADLLARVDGNVAQDWHDVKSGKQRQY